MISLDAAEVVVWSCAIVFLITAVITILALIGKITLGGGDGSNHDYYLKRLFNILIVEIVAISISAYADYLTGKYQKKAEKAEIETEKTRLHKTYTDEKLNKTNEVLAATRKELKFIKHGLETKLTKECLAATFWPEITKNLAEIETTRQEAEKRLLLDEKNIPTDYLIEIKTSTKRNANTGEKVYLSMYGTMGVLENIRLNDIQRNDFERGSLDRFPIRSATNVGELQKIKLEIKDNNKDGKINGWFPESIKIKNLNLNRSWEFALNQWLDDKPGRQQSLHRSFN